MDTLVPKLPGFDTAAALKLLANNENLYIKILGRFHAQYASSYESLADLILTGDDWEAIQREAHTIKGLAGSIGHPGLQAVALELEMSAKDKDSLGVDVVREKGKAFLEVFSTVLCQLGAAFAD